MVWFLLAFLYSCFFCLLVCFLKSKIYILTHIWQCGLVSDKKKFHPADFRKQDYKLLFWPDYRYIKIQGPQPPRLPLFFTQNKYFWSKIRPVLKNIYIYFTKWNMLLSLRDLKLLLLVLIFCLFQIVLKWISFLVHFLCHKLK